MVNCLFRNFNGFVWDIYKMKIEFIGKNDEEEKPTRYISFWGGRVKFNFEITWNEKTEDVIIFEKELKLNLENQLSEKYNEFVQDKTPKQKERKR